MLIHAEHLFFFSIAFIFYVYVVYILVLKAVSLFRSRRVKKGDITPFVTILIPCHNEEKDILNTVENKLSGIDYPADKMEVIAIDDGSTDNTARILKSIKDSRFKVVSIGERRGKTNALNEGLRAAKGEIIVFSDANSIYERNAVRKLVSNFADQDVGYVTGKMINFRREGCLISEGTSAYNEYENSLRELESRVNSIIGCDGGIDAVRKRLFRPVDPAMIPDFFIPLKVIEQGYRVVYEPEAISKEDISRNTGNEFKMRVRVIVRSFNAMFRLKHLLNPIVYSLFSFQLFSHKVLRYLVPLVQVLLFFANLQLVGYSEVYTLFLIGQIAFYLSAIYGYTVMSRGDKPKKYFYVPYYFNLVNFASLIAIIEFLSGERYVVWEPRKGVKTRTSLNIINNIKDSIRKALDKYEYWPYWACIMALLAYLYAPTLKWMYTRFMAEDSYYSHGFLIPFITIYLIWQKRDELKDIPKDYSWWGLPCIFAAMLIHLAAMVVYFFSPSGFSMPMLVIGLCLFVYGKEITKRLLFPMLFLLFMCPLPFGVIGKIAFAMKMGVSRISADIVNALGIPVFREGFFVDTINGQLVIDNPCSGLRSLISFLALGALFAYFFGNGRLNRAFLFIITVPIAFLVNIIRVVFLIMVANYEGISQAAAGSTLHDVSGFLVFIFGTVILFGIGRMLEWKN